MPSRSDLLLTDLRAAGFSGSIADMERQRLGNTFGLSLSDLRAAANESPTSDFGKYRKNLFRNPTFGVDANYWNAWPGVGGNITAVRKTDGGYIGPNYGRLTFTAVPSVGGGWLQDIGLAGRSELGAGRTIATRAYIRPSRALNISPQIQFFIDAVPTGISAYPGSIACPANQWTEINWSAVAASGDNIAQVRWYVSGSGITTINDYIDISNAIGSFDGIDTYFDGSTATNGNKKYVWMGTPHGSVSYERITR